MATIAVTRAALAGFGVLRRKPWAPVVWSGLYIVFLVAILALVGGAFLTAIGKINASAAHPLPPEQILGLFGAVGFSWAGIVIGSSAQLGGLAAYYDNGDSQAYPAGFPGQAAAGLAVYRGLGCAACHTQQVRRPDFGSDVARGWGERQSVARDYIFQSPVQLGQSRIGPDLANLGGRKPAPPSADELMALLYTGRGGMPGYSFLFHNRPIIGQPSERALLPMSAALRPGPGREIVPGDRAELLVSYLLSLNTVFDYPEARPPPPPPGAKPAEAAKAGHK